MYENVPVESDTETGKEKPLTVDGTRSVNKASKRKQACPGTCATCVGVGIVGIAVLFVTRASRGVSRAEDAVINRRSPVKPLENMHDGNVCDDTEEVFHGFCYTKCSLLTKGTHPYRNSAFTCCEKSPCGMNILKMESASLVPCHGFDVSSADGGKACPHGEGVCLTDEELFKGKCFEKCTDLTDDKFPKRTSNDKCCDSTGLQCLNPHHYDKEARLNVGGGASDGDESTPSTAHAPLKSLAEADVIVTSVPPVEVTLEDLPGSFVSALTELYGKPVGKFLRGKHGITNFHLEGPESAPRGLAVLSHGIGTNMDAYQPPVREALIDAGYRVLRYSFLGHGWSYAAADVVPPGGNRPHMSKYNKDVFLEQVNELLDLVLRPDAPIDLWVGHSTGGVVGVLQADAAARPVKRLALISPAFWAVKPMLVRALDLVPRLTSSVVTSVKALHKVVAEEYLENCDNAFAHNGSTYFFPEQHKQATHDIKQMFALHPQIVDAILGVNMFFLTGKLLEVDRPIFQSLEESGEVDQTCLLWGTLDIVVPFEHAQDVVSWSPDRVRLVKLENMGHESPKEDPYRIAEGLRSCLSS